jgi:hypothetical protein
MKLITLLLLLVPFPFISTSMEPADYYSFLDSLPPLVDTKIVHYTPAISSVPSHSSFDEESLSLSPSTDNSISPESFVQSLAQPVPSSSRVSQATPTPSSYTCGYPLCNKRFRNGASCYFHYQTHFKKPQKESPQNSKRRRSQETDETCSKKALLSLSCPFTACTFKTDSQQVFDDHCTKHKDAIANRFIGLLARRGTPDC